MGTNPPSPFRAVTPVRVVAGLLWGAPVVLVFTWPLWRTGWYASAARAGGLGGDIVLGQAASVALLILVAAVLRTAAVALLSRFDPLAAAWVLAGQPPRRAVFQMMAWDAGAVTLVLAVFVPRFVLALQRRLTPPDEIEQTLWSLAFDMVVWWPCVGPLLMRTGWLWMYHSADGPHCSCGYLLRGNVSGRCPECGRPTDTCTNWEDVAKALGHTVERSLFGPPFGPRQRRVQLVIAVAFFLVVLAPLLYIAVISLSLRG